MKFSGIPGVDMSQVIPSYPNMIKENSSKKIKQPVMLIKNNSYLIKRKKNVNPEKITVSEITNTSYRLIWNDSPAPWTATWIEKERFEKEYTLLESLGASLPTSENTDKNRQILND